MKTLSTTLALLLVLLLPTAAVACPPPPQPEASIDADMHVCGDPRIVGSVTNTGDISVTVTLRFKSGNRDTWDGKRFPVRKVERELRPGQTWSFKRWAKGGSVAWVEVDYDNVRYAFTRVNRQNNIGACPR